MQSNVNEADWKLFRSKLPSWQENFMHRLNTEYMEILSREGKRPSEIFWELENRLRRDRRLTGVVADGVSRSNMDTLILSLLGEHAITLDDLVDFSEELQERMKWIVEGWATQEDGDDDPSC